MAANVKGQYGQYSTLNCVHNLKRLLSRLGTGGVKVERLCSSGTTVEYVEY